VGTRAITDRSAGRLGHIDALRGFAALSVCVAHCADTMIAGLGDGQASAAIRLTTIDGFDLGRFGVVLFFLISGLVIPFSLGGPRPLERFAISRVFRLYPAYWLSMLVTIAVAVLIEGRSVPPVRIAANVTMAPGLLGQPYVSGVYWTLFVELVFYAACALLFASRLLHRPIVILLVTLGCVALPLAGVAARSLGRHAPVLYLGAHLSFLFAGALIRMALIERRPRAGACAAVALVAALAAMPLLGGQPGHVFTVSTPLGVTLAAAAAAAVFVSAVWRPFAPSRAWIWAGAISYSVYLFHIPATHVVRAALPERGGAAMAALLILTLALTIAVASLVYVAIERPCIEIGRKLIRARRRSLALEVAP
jgi:peptidoglycan/LPS O-acetylase OafA/YrhL